MDRHALVRWAGIAAIAGGVLRGVTALLPTTQTLAIHLTYLATDLLLLLAVAGLFAFQRERIGGLGALGALVTVLGSGLLIFDDLFSPNFALYPIAAVVFALGLGVFALGAWRAQPLPGWITVLWLAAIVVGALGLGVAALHILFVLSGVLFAVGFVGAGQHLYAAPDGAKTDASSYWRAELVMKDTAAILVDLWNTVGLSLEPLATVTVSGHAATLPRSFAASATWASTGAPLLNCGTTSRARTAAAMDDGRVFTPTFPIFAPAFSPCCAVSLTVRRERSERGRRRCLRTRRQKPAVAMERTFTEWDALPQGRAIASLQTLALTKIGDAPSQPLLRNPDRPLTGVRVLDLRCVIAGPVCRPTLAVHGSDVLNVTSERPAFLMAIHRDPYRSLSSGADAAVFASAVAFVFAVLFPVAVITFSRVTIGTVHFPTAAAHMTLAPRS